MHTHMLCSSYLSFWKYHNMSVNINHMDIGWVFYRRSLVFQGEFFGTPHIY